MPSHDQHPLLRTVREVVTLLGGTSAAASRLSVSPAAVSIWLRKNRIPPARYLDVSAAVEEHGRHIDRSLFRETPRPKSETHAA
jgi:predicted transcriptional regulator